MSSLLKTRFLSAEQFADLSQMSVPKELVRGCIVEQTMPGFRHGYLCMQIGYLLSSFIRENDLGRMLSNDTFIVTRRDPDTVRGADLCFYSYARLPKGPIPEKFADKTPDLVFEVRSPWDRWIEVIAKTTEYLEAGVSVVCVVDPKDQTMSIYRADENPRILTIEDAFVLPDILPGFTIPIRKFFE